MVKHLGSRRLQFRITFLEQGKCLFCPTLFATDGNYSPTYLCKTSLITCRNLCSTAGMSLAHFGSVKALEFPSTASTVFLSVPFEIHSRNFTLQASRRARTSTFHLVNRNCLCSPLFNHAAIFNIANSFRKMCGMQQ